LFAAVFFVNEDSRRNLHPEGMMTDWHLQEKEAVLNRLNTHPERGLDAAEAASRLAKDGPNELIDRGGKHPLKILWEQLTGIMTVILIVSAVISLFLHDIEDAVAILAIVVLNTILGFTQEYRAERAMAALKKMAVPHVRVRRGGSIMEISARELVAGDLIYLEAGNYVPADARVVESVNMRVQEAVLTGESEPVEKIAAAFSQPNMALGDQRNRVFMGTLVTYGRGMAVVTETGMRTELGRIAELIQGVVQEQTPLQRRLEQLARGLAIAALIVVAVVFGLGLLRGEELRLMFLTAISMAVAAVPEGLPTVVTIGLAFGAQRMLGRKALIRKLPAVETLGSITVICSDKTGTLTQNLMTVTYLDVADHRLNLREQMQDYSPTLLRGETNPELAQVPAVAALLAGGALCNDAILEPLREDPERMASVGDPTEGALVIAAARGGLWKDALEKILPRVGELPFDSDRKRMTTLHQIADGPFPGGLETLVDASGWIAFTKGAVDGLLDVTTQIWSENGVQPIDASWKERIRLANNSMAGEGMRVLGIAYRSYSTPPDLLEEKDLVFVGLVGMIDPARPEVQTAVRNARSAGIRPIMITGDHPLTALAIARELGIAAEDTSAITGQQLAELDKNRLADLVGHTSVFARVSPEHKLKIVEALQSRGEVVAMTGDGVNDAPALKRADIGVAMGITGTDVSKESADMILLDDNFATIVAAVEEGRRIYDNIRKFIKYALGSNVGEILVMLIAPFLGMPLPLLPLQILWINLVTDGLPGLALTVEKAESNTMRRPPFHPKAGVFSHGLGRNIGIVGVTLTLLTLGVGYAAWVNGVEAWQTMAFTTLTLAQMGNVLAIRSGRDSLFKQGLFSNLPLLASVLLTILLQLGVIYLPFMQHIFETQALTLSQLGMCLLASLALFFVVEVEKWLVRRGTLQD
jgi:P-type Ca2+ transporter type 2C